MLPDPDQRIPVIYFSSKANGLPFLPALFTVYI